MKPLNIYHITVAKTASRWFAKFFEHPQIMAFTHMNRYDYETMGYGKWDERDFVSRKVERKILKNHICSPLYMGFDNYHDIPKPAHYKSFCLWRDPRDVLISFYFSCRYSHPQIGKHPAWRAEIEKRNFEDGMCWTMELLQHELKIFDALKSYENCEERDPNCKLFKYFMVFGKYQFETMHNLLRWLELDVPEGVLRNVLTEMSFEARTGGRKRGEENLKNHLRKGIAGDWMNHLTPAMEERFWEIYGTDTSLRDNSNRRSNPERKRSSEIDVVERRQVGPTVRGNSGKRVAL